LWQVQQKISTAKALQRGAPDIAWGTAVAAAWDICPPPRHRPPLPRGLLYQKLANEFREFSEYFAEISRLSAQVKQPFLNEVHRDFSYTFNCCFKDVPGLLDDPKYLLVPALHEYSFG